MKTPKIWKNTSKNKFKTFIKESGVKVWRKPVQRLPANRETELIEEYSINVACKWIGSSPKTAMENHHKMRDVHFINATRATPDFCPTPEPSLDETECSTEFWKRKAVGQEKIVGQGESIDQDENVSHNISVGQGETVGQEPKPSATDMMKLPMKRSVLSGQFGFQHSYNR